MNEWLFKENIKLHGEEFNKHGIKYERKQTLDHQGKKFEHIQNYQ